jgi:hypothetical protein
MASRSLVVCALVAAVAAGPATAGERDHALIDKVDVRPSPLNGLARVRALVSATELQGARIPQEGKPELTVKLGGAKVPFAWGLAAQAEVELDVVLVVATTDAFAGSLETIREALDVGLLTPLEKLGPRVQIAVIGYGNTTVGQKRLETVAKARAALAKLEVEDVTTEVALVKAVSDAGALALAKKPKQPGLLQRPIVIVVSDGDGVPVETRAEVTKLGQTLGKKGVRVHALGFSPTKARKPLLTLGELAKQSSGTFRWIQEVEGWPVALGQLVDQLANQYVLTALAPLDDVGGKKLVVAINFAGEPLAAPDVKLPGPRCGKETCEADAYCVRDVCVARARRPGRGVLLWIMLGGGGVLGLVAIGLGGRAIARRRGAPRPAPAPQPVGPAPMMAAAPPPVAVAPGGPVLIVMSGPEAGRQVPLHHGFTLGKAPGHHLSLAHDGTASSNHAQITFDGQAWTLTDLGSTNGTFANGNRVTSVRLFPGMTVRLGSTDLRFWQP